MAAQAAESPAVAVGPEPAEAATLWGPPSGGLAARLAVEGNVAVGSAIRITVFLRSAAGGAVTLPPAQTIVGWIAVAQTTPGSKKGFYSERIFFAKGAADWPTELSGERVLASKPIDIAGLAAYSNEDGRNLLMAYLAEASGKPAEALPAGAGKLGKLLATGKAGAKFTVCLPVAGANPVLVTTNKVDFLIGAPDYKTLSPEARKAFEADLLKQFDRDAWSGSQAHDAAAALGQEPATPEEKAVSEIIKMGGQVGGDPHVTNVAVMGDKVTDAGLRNLKEFKSLQELWFYDPKITDASLKELKDLKEIKSLWALGFQNTRITDAGLKDLKELKSLKLLDLSRTLVTGTGLKDLKELQNLQTLKLGGSKVTDDGLKDIKEFKGLRKLELNDTQITDAGLKDLKTLTGLKELDLSDTKITDAGLKDLKELKGLKRLDLIGVQITDAGLKDLKELKGLQWLNLCFTQVTDAGLKDLEELKDLQLFMIVGTKITESGLKELKQALPKAHIDWKLTFPSPD